MMFRLKNLRHERNIKQKFGLNTAWCDFTLVGLSQILKDFNWDESEKKFLSDLISN